MKMKGKGTGEGREAPTFICLHSADNKEAFHSYLCPNLFQNNLRWLMDIWLVKQNAFKM